MRWMETPRHEVRGLCQPLGLERYWILGGAKDADHTGLEMITGSGDADVSSG